MKKLVINNQEELTAATKVVESMINNSLHFWSGFNVSVYNGGSFANIKVYYANCCEITNVTSNIIIKVFNKVLSTYKDSLFTIGGEKYFVERLNNYLYRPTFNLTLYVKEDKKKNKK